MRRAAVLLLTFASLACTQPPWVDVSSTQHGFRARFPETPEETAGSAPAEQIYTGHHLGWLYRIDVQTIPDGRVIDRDALYAVRDARMKGMTGAGLTGTRDFDENGGFGIEYVTREAHAVERVVRIFRRDHRLFSVEIAGRGRVVESADARDFFAALSIDARPDPPPVAKAPQASEAAIRDTTKSYLALVKSRRYDEADRYLPPVAKITPQAHARFWSAQPADLVENIDVVSIAVTGSNARVAVGSRTGVVQLHAVGQGRTVSVAPAPLFP